MDVQMLMAFRGLQAKHSPKLPRGSGHDGDERTMLTVIF